MEGKVKRCVDDVNSNSEYMPLDQILEFFVIKLS
jgi:hypothetical protein